MEKEKKRYSIFAEWDGKYLGNMWGWKFSYISLGLIVFLFLLLFMTKKINEGKELPAVENTEIQD